MTLKDRERADRPRWRLIRHLGARSARDAGRALLALLSVADWLLIIRLSSRVARPRPPAIATRGAPLGSDNIKLLIDGQLGILLLKPVGLR